MEPPLGTVLGGRPGARGEADPSGHDADREQTAKPDDHGDYVQELEDAVRIDQEPFLLFLDKATGGNLFANLAA
jgi:hypothetical protein